MKLKKLYLYSATMLALACLAIGLAKLTALTLETWVFTDANKTIPQQDLPLLPPDLREKLDDRELQVQGLLEEQPNGLSQTQIELLSDWETKYKSWLETHQTRREFDFAKQRRDKNLAWGISLLLVGGIIWFTHIKLIKD